MFNWIKSRKTIQKYKLLNALLISLFYSNSAFADNLVEKIPEENIDKYVSEYSDYKPPMSFSTDFEKIYYY